MFIQEQLVATTVFTLSINDDGTYTYTQVGQLDHADGTNANDVISLNFGFKATDADGDVANGTITIKVLDDAPVAVNDVATLAQPLGQCLAMFLAMIRLAQISLDML
jgi:T1SS-143 domain-containing protein